MKQFQVTGMSCAACSARVEKAVLSVDGVKSCAVSLLTNSMGVEGDADEAAIVAAVVAAGYGATPENKEKTRKSVNGDPLRDTESPKLWRRLLVSLGFLLLLMYLSMGHMMWNFPLPAKLAENPLAMALCQLLLSGVVLVINQAFFISGFKAAWRRSPNMDSLVAMGSGVSFLYSVAVLFLMNALHIRNLHSGLFLQTSRLCQRQRVLPVPQS